MAAGGWAAARLWGCGSDATCVVSEKGVQMNAQDTSRCTAEEIVRQAAGKSRSERPAFLRASCGADAALRARVELLLAELMVPAGLQTSTLTPCSHPLTARSDRYRLLQQIGEGGFGTVSLSGQAG